MVDVLTFSEAQRRRAACALLKFERGETDRSKVHALLHGAATSIAEDGRIEGAARIDKYRGLTLLHSDCPVRAPFLGGLFRATLAEDMTEQLAKIDDDLRIELLAIARTAFEAAADRVAVKIRREANRSKLDAVQQYAFDNDSPVKFVASLPRKLSDRLAADLTSDEEELARRELEQSATLIDEALAAASALVLATLPGDNLGAVADRHEADRSPAVQMFLVAMTALVLGRLGRGAATEGRAVLPGEVEVPPNLVNDVMSVAGGARPTSDGGLAKNADGRPVSDSGEELAGSRFAQGDTSSTYLREEFGLAEVVRFRHSGGADGNPLHVQTDGSLLSETGVRPGGPGCRCWESTEYEDPS